MKKVILAAIAVMTFGFANAQDGGFKAGAHIGLPMGDVKDSYSLNLGADVAYTWKIADKFTAGVTTGYTTYFGKSINYSVLFLEANSGSFKIPNAGFIPVAGTAQYSLTDKLFVGADLGYAIYVGSGDSKGGFLYQPKFGYQAAKYEVYAAYKGIAVNRGTFSSLNLGVNYKF